MLPMLCLASRPRGLCIREGGITPLERVAIRGRVIGWLRVCYRIGGEEKKWNPPVFEFFLSRVSARKLKSE